MNESNIQAAVGFGPRLIAGIIDVIITSIPVFLIGLAANGDAADNIGRIIGLLYGIALPVLWGGRTVGKRVIGSRIVRVDGRTVGWGTMILRYLVGSLVYGFTLGIAAIVSLIMVCVREDKRSVHDFIAGTQVVTD